MEEGLKLAIEGLAKVINKKLSAERLDAAMIDANNIVFIVLDVITF